MNNPTPTTPNSTTPNNSTAPKTDQKNPAQQTNTDPKSIGGDQKNDAKNDVSKENKDIKAS